MSRASSALRTCFYGAPPGPGATPIEGLRYLRRILAPRPLARVPLLALAAVLVASAAVGIAAALFAVVSLLSIAMLSRELARTGRDEATLH